MANAKAKAMFSLFFLPFKPWAVASFVTLCFLSYIVWRAIYNRYLHPLSKFPGPILGSLTDLYLVFMIKTVPTFGLQLHKKYGPIIRLAPNLLSFSDPELLPEVYHRNADKPAFYASWMFGDTAAMFQTLDHKHHSAKKKLVATCCSMNVMKQYHEPKISECIDELCRKFGERSAKTGRPLDFSEHLRWFLADTWNYLAYGQRLGHVDQGRDVNGHIAALQGVYSMSATAAVMPWLMPLLRHPTWRRYFWAITPTFRNLNRLFDHFDDMRQKRLIDPDTQQQRLFFESLEPMKDSCHEFQFTPSDLLAEYITFTAATLDGAAALISPFIDNLVHSPIAYRRVVAEIDSAARELRLSHPVATYDETCQLPYFLACLRETLRRDAPAQTILPRVVSKPGYHLYNGTVFVPSGAHMGASPFIIHRNARIFGPEPEAWKPERWLPGKESSGLEGAEHEAYIRRMEKYGQWWGYGDRECAGKFYGYMEVQKLLVEILRRFHIRGVGGYRHEKWAVGMYWDQGIMLERRETIRRVSAKMGS